MPQPQPHPAPASALAPLPAAAASASAHPQLQAACSVCACDRPISSLPSLMCQRAGAAAKPVTTVGGFGTPAAAGGLFGATTAAPSFGMTAATGLSFGGAAATGGGLFGAAAAASTGLGTALGLPLAPSTSSALIGGLGLQTGLRRFCTSLLMALVASSALAVLGRRCTSRGSCALRTLRSVSRGLPLFAPRALSFALLRESSGLPCGSHRVVSHCP